MHPVPCRHAPRLRSLVLGDVGRTSERGPACCHGRPARRAVTAFPLSLLAPGCVLLTRRRLTGHLYSGERLHGWQALLLSVRGRDRRPTQRLGPGCPSPGSSSPCAWDQHVRAAVVSGLPSGNTRSLLEKVLTRSPRLVGLGSRALCGGQPGCTPLPRPRHPLTAPHICGLCRALETAVVDAH